jgi:nicotinate phosphoribosyltransferase
MDYIATFKEIREGKTTDIYFKRTVDILKARGLEGVRVQAEVFLKRFPENYRWGVFAGLPDALAIFEGKEVSVKALPEGTLFMAEEPVMVIEGPYAAFAELETAVLGVLCQASGIATKSARVKMAAGDKLVFSFGARRMHPALSVFIERNAYIGGADGLSTVLCGKKIGIEPSGTIPHALILVMGDTLEAMRAFAQVEPPGVKRICLIDTFQDEKFEAIRIADAFGKDLFAIRLDTPSSRRGDFKKILQEVRWELDIRGHEKVNIIVSGGLSEDDILDLRNLVDGFGVGTCISNSPVLDFSLDIVSVEGKNMAKRGKMSGAKEVALCNRCLRRNVTLEGAEKACPCGGQCTSLFSLVLKEGTIVRPPETLDDLRKRVKEGIITFGREP